MLFRSSARLRLLCYIIRPLCFDRSKLRRKLNLVSQKVLFSTLFTTYH